MRRGNNEKEEKEGRDKGEDEYAIRTEDIAQKEQEKSVQGKRGGEESARGCQAVGCNREEGCFRALVYDVSLLGAAGSGGGDAVRLMGCEGSVSLAWKTGEG